VVIKRFDVYLSALDPTVGSEMQKTRPCLVISPDEANRQIATVLIAPMTSGGYRYPSHVACRFRDKDGTIILDQLRVADKTRLLKYLGRITTEEQEAVLASLAEMFA
jgi:mRNA interferase MazF